MMQTQEQAEHDYDVQLGRLVNALRGLADRVEHAGDAHRPRTLGMSSTRTRPDRTFLASDVHDLVLGWAGERNSHLTSLMFAAISAQHATARGTPAELLDRAATGIAEVAHDTPGCEVVADDALVALAEAALRGAGVIQ